METEDSKEKLHQISTQESIKSRSIAKKTIVPLESIILEALLNSKLKKD